MAQMWEINREGIGQAIDREQFTLGPARVCSNQLLAEINAHQAICNGNTAQLSFRGENWRKTSFRTCNQRPNRIAQAIFL